MALFDKLNQAAKNIGDKTGDVIEITKLNARISSENSAADEELKKLGEFLYAKFAGGGETEPETLGSCEKIKTHREAAAAAKAEIERIKGGEAQTGAAAPAERKCPGCGAVVQPGVKYCPECGRGMED